MSKHTSPVSSQNSVQFDQDSRVMSQVVAARCEIIQLWSSNQINQTWWQLACNVIHSNLGTSVISIDRQTGEVLTLTWLSEAALLAAKWSLTRFDAKAVKLWRSLFVIYHMIHMITCMTVSQQQLCGSFWIEMLTFNRQWQRISNNAGMWCYCCLCLSWIHLGA